MRRLIKMIIKGRKVPQWDIFSRTQWVARDWLFDRIDVDTQNPKPLHGHQTPTRRHVDLQWISRVMNGNNLLHLFNISHFLLHIQHQEFQFDKLLHTGEEDSKSKKKKKQLCPSRDQQWCIRLLPYLLRQVPPPHRNPIASKIPGMPIASVRPGSRMSVWTKLIRRSVDRLRCHSRMHTLAGWWKSSGETRRIK